MHNIEVGLLNLALDNGIGVTIRRDIPDNMPSFCRTDIKKIMVNANRHDYIFSFAHEIGHILNDDTGISPLFYSGTNRSKDEAAANRTAINLLLPYYCSEKNKYVANAEEFTMLFKTPKHLYTMIENELKNYFE